MRLTFGILMLFFVEGCVSQKASGRYFQEGFPIENKLKIKCGNKYKLISRYDKLYWHDLKHPIVKVKCIRPVKRNRKRITRVVKGIWTITGDTLTLTLTSENRGNGNKHTEGATIKYRVVTNGLKDFISDSTIYRRRNR